MSPKADCFAGFCYHNLAPMSAHTHAYRYPLFESGTMNNHLIMYGTHQL